MKIKMIVTDLDGTLLRDDKSISPNTLAALWQCREKGIKLAYATARGPTADLVVPENLFHGKIQANGARAYAGDMLAYSKRIPGQLAKPFLSACIKHGLNIYSQTDGISYANFVVTDVWPDTTCFKIVDLLQHDQDADKLCAVIGKPADEAFIREQLPPDLHAYSSRNSDVMVMHKEATKVLAISELARMWGITAPEIAAFGDDVNDIDMLKYAGIGIAMGNALDAVKNIADDVSLSNEEDGIANWVQRHRSDFA
jgi:Cof subfamily protein (haloacid dehalogenase superfamily)